MNKIEAILACDCRVRLSVDSDALNGHADAYCRFHSYNAVVEKFPSEWRVICLSCTFGRWCGQKEDAAARVARKHKHNCIYGIDTITKSNGTARKILIKRWLREREPTAKLVENELPPF